RGAERKKERQAERKRGRREGESRVHAAPRAIRRYDVRGGSVQRAEVGCPHKGGGEGPSEARERSMEARHAAPRRLLSSSSSSSTRFGGGGGDMIS
ncbi:hypothetical protein ALC56_01269, partial [Trachymyrmex septentrionalis]